VSDNITTQTNSKPHVSYPERLRNKEYQKL